MEPCAWSMVKRTQLTVRGERVTGKGFPPVGRGPTVTLLPSLNDSVPASTLSAVSRRS